jgi:histidinol-phosphate phosphatase family protein
MPVVLSNFNSALFLDRDGVINRQIIGDYVRNLAQFELLPGAVDAIARLGKLFRHVIVVTNQQGIGKGLMNAADADEIHDYMTCKVQAAGGRIDRIYCCPSPDTANDPCRKPGIGMGLQAQHDFPDIDFSRSLMIGDSSSDMLFAERLGMQTIFITNGKPAPKYVEHVCDSLANVPEMLAQTKLKPGGHICIPLSGSHCPK